MYNGENSAMVNFFVVCEKCKARFDLKKMPPTGKPDEIELSIEGMFQILECQECRQPTRVKLADADNLHTP